jgi:hypothetical protein
MPVAVCTWMPALASTEVAAFSCQERFSRRAVQKGILILLFLSLTYTDTSRRGPVRALMATMPSILPCDAALSARLLAGPA